MHLLRGTLYREVLSSEPTLDASDLDVPDMQIFCARYEMSLHRSVLGILQAGQVSLQMLTSFF